MANLASKTFALVPVAAFAATVGEEEPIPTMKTRVRKLARRTLSGLFALEELDRFFDKRVNLVFCIAASF